MNNADMPAMPTEDIYLGYDEVECRELNAASRGLTKREQIAAMAMQGLLANSEVIIRRGCVGADAGRFIFNYEVASESVRYAEELLKELEK